MRYTAFGRRTGPRVSEYALGTANAGTRWGAGAEPDEARRMSDRFAEAGGTFIDTADTYRFGESEDLTGELIGADRNAGRGRPRPSSWPPSSPSGRRPSRASPGRATAARPWSRRWRPA
ncbi:aldo/keto reductase [Streptomyces sp. SP18CS02]|uniref:aldo/keto reductase n=1 Tax=Streptomyces sp. SP18CS02 TaxID=3002531 RepID=UPI002E78DFA1|nr:aldo/keto reductase [Streptomyces sp. SP18CS02]MEE1753044.1 aldo/keto reductase [Streptomyces sp. SP18CS02]